jgi:hypothetical protein
MTVAPAAEIAELLHFVVIVLHVVLHGEAGRVEYADVTAQSKEDARGFESK